MSELVSPRHQCQSNKAHSSTDTIFLELERVWKAMLSVFIAGHDSEEETFQASEKEGVQEDSP